MATLAADVTATQTSWNVSAMPDADFLQADDEIVKVIDQRRTENRIRVQRGYAGTTAASHLSAAELTPVYVPSVGGGGGGGVTVDNQDDPPAEVTTLIAVGATIAGDEATLADQVVLSRTVTLTDAQIKALPGTDVEIVPDVAAGKIVAVVGGLIYCDTNAGAYTNIDAAAEVFIQYSSGNEALSYIEEAVGGVSDLIGLGGIRVSLLGPVASHSFGTSTVGHVIGDIETAGLEISGNNAAAGSFTGGNAANSMKVTVFYVVVDL